ncbi:hypothetical protein FAY30_22865 [Bacillus sp. S3]|nr:hypothetical protein FAY30_22865 [Bacillus sp. S3]
MAPQCPHSLPGLGENYGYITHLAMGNYACTFERYSGFCGCVERGLAAVAILYSYDFLCDYL